MRIIVALHRGYCLAPTKSSKMIKIKKGKYYSHPEVVAASQELDAVLDKYQVMLENIKLDEDEDED